MESYVRAMLYDVGHCPIETVTAIRSSFRELGQLAASVNALEVRLDASETPRFKCMGRYVGVASPYTGDLFVVVRKKNSKPLVIFAY